MTIKYFPNNEFAEEPFHDWGDAVGYDLFAAETKTLLPQTCNSVELELRMAIPKGYFGKIFPRSGLLKNHFITCDAGVVNADYRRSLSVFMNSHHKDKSYTVRIGNRFTQMVFFKKYDENFDKVSKPGLLGKTKCGIGGFGSTGLNWNILSKRPLPPTLELGEVCIVSDDSSESDDWFFAIFYF